MRLNRKILFELENVTLPTGTGIATYARNLVEAAAQLDFEAEGLLHQARRIPHNDPELTAISILDACNARTPLFDRLITLPLRRLIGAPFGWPVIPVPRRDVVFDQSNKIPADLANLYAAARFHQIARFHFNRFGKTLRLRTQNRPAIFHATQAIPLSVPGAKNVYTIHDLVPLRLPQSTLDDKGYFLRMTRHICRTADRIVTVSETSRRDIIDICGADPAKVVNTYQAVSLPQHLLDVSEEETRQLIERAFGLTYKNYYLFFGAIEPKKNVSRIVDAYLESGTTRQLVIASGRGWQNEADLRKINANRSLGYKIINGDHIVRDLRIRMLPYLPQHQLVALIRGARALLFPSLYEGFGLPVLESMLLGTPVLTSNGSSLREVAGEAAVLVEPTDALDMTRGLRRLDRDDKLCAELSARGREQAKKFSRANYVNRVKSLYEELLAEQSRP